MRPDMDGLTVTLGMIPGHTRGDNVGQPFVAVGPFFGNPDLNSLFFPEIL